MYIPVCNWVIELLVVVANATDDDGADSPEHLQHLCRGGTQPHGDNLTAVGWRVGNEDTPRNSLEKLGKQHDGERVGKVEDEDEAVQKHEAGNGSPAISDAAGEGSSKEATNHGTDWATDLECRLPLGYDNVISSRRIQDTVIVGECGQGKEVAHEEDAEGLHDLESTGLACAITMKEKKDAEKSIGLKRTGMRMRNKLATHNGEGHDKGPKGSQGISADSLQHSHVCLSIFCLDGTRPLGGDLLAAIMRGVVDVGDTLLDAGVGLVLGRRTHVAVCTSQKTAVYGCVGGETGQEMQPRGRTSPFCTVSPVRPLICHIRGEYRRRILLLHG